MSLGHVTVAIVVYCVGAFQQDCISSTFSALSERIAHLHKVNYSMLSSSKWIYYHGPLLIFDFKTPKDRKHCSRTIASTNGLRQVRQWCTKVVVGCMKTIATESRFAKFNARPNYSLRYFVQWVCSRPCKFCGCFVITSCCTYSHQTFFLRLKGVATCSYIKVCMCDGVIPMFTAHRIQKYMKNLVLQV